MKSLFQITFIGFAAIINLTAQNMTPQQEGSLFSIDVGNLLFAVDSAFGAKVSSLTLDGTEFMVTSDMVSTDYLWGATLWPSPQSEWDWINSDKLIWDHEEYTSSIDGDTMTFTGKNVSVDNGDSFYFIKNFWANSEDTTISLKYSMVNTTGKTIKKALWELTRVPLGGLTFWPTGPGGTWGDLAPACEEINDHTWYEREPEDGTNLKFFADGRDGWFAHVDDFGRLYIKTFEDVDQSEFANREGEIELWVADEYIELENQSACRDIPDLGQLDYEVKWYLLQLPDDMKVIAGNPALLAYVNWIISDRETPPASIASDKQKLSIDFFPNPAQNIIHFRMNGPEPESMKYMIMDILGKIFMEGDLSSGTIDVSNLTPGFYVIQLESEKQVLRKKFIIE